MRVLLFDANVLIDYFDAEPSVFASIRRSVGELHVVSRVLEEVEQLDELQATELGLQVFEPDLDVMASAATARGRLSFQDRLCLAVARAEGMTCVTNDTALRSQCSDEGVNVVWGLQLLVLAVKAGGLTPGDAAEIGRAIHELNPFIGEIGAPALLEGAEVARTKETGQLTPPAPTAEFQARTTRRRGHKPATPGAGVVSQNSIRLSTPRRGSNT